MIRERINLIVKLYSLIDLSIILGAFPAAYVMRRQLSFLFSLPELKEIGAYLPLLFFIVPIWMTLLYLNNTYLSYRGKSCWAVVWAVVKSNLEGISFLSLMLFMLKWHDFNRSLAFLFVLNSTLALSLEKILLFKGLEFIRKQGRNLKRMLIVGTDQRADMLIKRINQHPETGFVVIGFLSEYPEEIGHSVYGYPVFGSFDDLYRVLHREIVDEVVFASPIFALHKVRPLLKVCEMMGINSRIVVDADNDSSNFKLFIDNILDISLLSFSYRETQFFSLGLKRALDVVVSAVLLALLSPMLLLIGLLIRLQSPGPVIFKQERNGLNGRRFVMYKFRTMVNGAEAMREKLLAKNEASGPIFKMEHDPRITALGRVLRRTSLDELPQLWNVLKGEMSLVGPRPLPLVESSKITGRERRRLSMKPGITGLWQCHGRSRCQYEHLISFDLEYVDNWSLLLDMKLLVKTVPVVIRCIGAM